MSTLPLSPTHAVASNNLHSSSAPSSNSIAPLAKPTRTYRLSSYRWRSFLTFFGPLCLLAFYAFVCFGFLARPPTNNIVPYVLGDARWTYYIWFIIAIFALDWARSGLGNIEAAALMWSRLAPRNAMELMWHSDSNWANPLWWLRAFRSIMFRMFRMFRRSPLRPGHDTIPNNLWTMLSGTTILIYVALPLSGLTMEIANVLTYTENAAILYGPGPDTFNVRSYLNLPNQIASFWISGRVTAPPQGTLLYAPQGTRNVSATYLQDRATAGDSTIKIFAGPAVYEPVSGSAWGLSANLSCEAVPASKLQMLKIHAVGNYSVKTISTYNNTNKSSPPQWVPALDFDEASVVPQVYSDGSLVQNEPYEGGTLIDSEGSSEQNSIIIAADGLNSDIVGRSPYTEISNHDGWTFDSYSGNSPADSVTTSLLELYIWQSDGADDPILKKLLAENSDIISKANATIEIAAAGDPADILGRQRFQFVGFGIHCEVRTAVGHAILDPALRTYSSFRRGMAPSNGDLPDQSAAQAWSDMLPPQSLAVQSLNEISRENGDLPETPLGAFQGALGISPILLGAENSSSVSLYNVLTPQDFQLAMYKLLGESIIAMMGEGGVEAWYGDLKSLAPAKYLVAGAVSWIIVLVLLSLWALAMSIATLWMILLAGPRWAPSLGGFEMFKFGAQYAEEVNDFESVDFQGCGSALQRVPGMVGILPGTDKGLSAHSGMGFIGLSEIPALTKATYTHDRRVAAMTKVNVKC